MTSPQRKFVELFAGVGLVRLGLEKSGWECAFANDFDPQKQEVYELNFGHKHFLLDDIWNVASDDLPNADLITASFPCIDLSVAGHQRGISAEHSGTFWAMIKILEAAKLRKSLPKVIMLENVYGFISVNDGADAVAAILALNKLGYATDMFLLDAKHFVPQSRPRVFVVGILHEISNSVMCFRNDSELFGEWQSRLHMGELDIRPKKIVDLILRTPHLNWGMLDLPSPPVRNKQLKDVVERLNPEDPRWWSDEKVVKINSQIKEAHQRIIQQSKSSSSYFFGTIYRRMRNGRQCAELRSDGTAGCLRTPRGGSSKQIIVQSGGDKVKFRWMTPREYARLQGVPESYLLPKNEIQSYFAMGDAVCVPAISWIAEKVLKQILPLDHKTGE